MFGSRVEDKMGGVPGPMNRRSAQEGVDRAQSNDSRRSRWESPPVPAELSAAPVGCRVRS